MSSASSVASHVLNSLSTVNTTPKLSSVDQDSRVTAKYSTSTRSHFIPTMAPVNEIITTTPSSLQTTFPHHSTNSYTHFTIRPTSETSPTFKPISTTTRPATTLHNENIIYQDNYERSTFVPPTELPFTKSQVHESLTSLLKREGLFAMTKYLRQSGLDNVLNETGEYARRLCHYINQILCSINIWTASCQPTKQVVVTSPFRTRRKLVSYYLFLFTLQVTAWVTIINIKNRRQNKYYM